ncbi:MAG: peptidase C15 [Cyanobacteria bacterium J06648_16]
MAKAILLTSFRPWKAHQLENSSEVMLQRLAPQLPPHARWVSGLVVNFDLAPIQVIAQVQLLRPKLVLCCGMAERRTHLTIEQWGKGSSQQRSTRLDLATLAADTVHTRISTDAGAFVCNHLYYRLLEYVQTVQPSTHVLFVHVPKLTVQNWPVIEFDFLRLLRRLDAML